ncbi:MAG: hypothetical protein AAF682_06550 [Planctomycetota bacterium]
MGKALTRIVAACVLIVCASCGGLDPGTVRATPLQPPELDPLLGFGGRVRIDANTSRDRLAFQVEVLRGTEVQLRRDLGELAFGSPCTVTVASENTEGGGTLRIELEDAAGKLSSIGAPLPVEFPAQSKGMTAALLLREELVQPEAERIPVFALTRGGQISFVGVRGPFGADETVLRVVALLR